MTKFSLALSLAATSLLGCVADVPETADCADDSCAADDSAVTSLQWTFVDRGAKTISVTVNDIVYIVNSPGSATGNVYYWHTQLAECANGDLQCSDSRGIWTKVTRSKFRTANVDSLGGGLAIDANGKPFQDAYQPIEGEETSGRFLEPNVWLPIGNHCFQEIERYHQYPNSVWFQDRSGPIGPGSLDYRYYATSCTPDANGDRQISIAIGAASYETTNLKAKELTIWSEGTSGQAMVFLTSAGKIFKFDNITGTAKELPAPPSKALDLTDHYVLTKDGIYKFKNNKWEFYIASKFADGSKITKIAAAGKVAGTNSRGSFITGESHLWATNADGSLHRADLVVDPR